MIFQFLQFVLNDSTLDPCQRMLYSKRNFWEASKGPDASAFDLSIDALD